MTTETELADRLSSVIHDLEGYTERRAREIAAPLVKAAEDEVRGQLLEVKEESVRSYGRQQACIDELRRQLDERDRQLALLRREAEARDRASRAVPEPIGRDIDLLCEAVGVAAAATSGQTGAQQIQRKVRVGWVKASHLVALMDDYGVTEYGHPYHRVLISREQVAETQERLRQIAAKEQDGG
jgi:hypothetical protein